MTDTSLHGSLAVPGDKSISHRALMFSGLCKGEISITGLSPAEDCLSTAKCMRSLGLKIEQVDGKADHVLVSAPGLEALTAPEDLLDAGNSGTTIRILSGLVAGRHFTSRFDGDNSLRRRPMSRVLDLLAEMGATIEYEKKGYAPFAIHGQKLKGKDFNLPVASAQVQTALLLAGLQAEGSTVVSLPQIARDHTLRMFRHMGIPFQEDGNTVTVSTLKGNAGGFKVEVPADISSAAFFLVGAACLKNSVIVMKNCGMNPGRTLIVDVLKRMGAELELQNERVVSGEPVADIQIRCNGRLQGATISGDEVASGVDEIPILALAGALCDGRFVVEGASELRHKESDRLAAITTNLRNAGADISDREDGFEIQGRPTLAGNSAWSTHNDHRLAMTGLIANIICQQPLNIEETESIKISYPAFEADLKTLLSNGR